MATFYCHSPAPLCFGCVRVYKIYHFSTDYWTVMSSIWIHIKGMLIILDVELGRQLLSSSGDRISEFSIIYRRVALYLKRFFFLMKCIGREILGPQQSGIIKLVYCVFTYRAFLLLITNALSSWCQLQVPECDNGLNLDIQSTFFLGHADWSMSDHKKEKQRNVIRGDRRFLTTLFELTEIIMAYISNTSCSKV